MNYCNIDLLGQLRKHHILQSLSSDIKTIVLVYLPKAPLFMLL